MSDEIDEHGISKSFWDRQEQIRSQIRTEPDADFSIKHRWERATEIKKHLAQLENFDEIDLREHLIFIYRLIAGSDAEWSRATDPRNRSDWTDGH